MEHCNYQLDTPVIMMIPRGRKEFKLRPANSRRSRNYGAPCSSFKKVAQLARCATTWQPWVRLGYRCLSLLKYASSLAAFLRLCLHRCHIGRLSASWATFWNCRQPNTEAIWMYSCVTYCLLLADFSMVLNVCVVCIFSFFLTISLFTGLDFAFKIWFLLL